MNDPVLNKYAVVTPHDFKRYRSHLLTTFEAGYSHNEKNMLTLREIVLSDTTAPGYRVQPSI